MKTIITHSGGFHPDELFAIATLKLYFKNEKFKIVRTRDEEKIKSGDIVVDVGGTYNSKKMRFDHHQTGGAGARENAIPYASFGIVWNVFGKKLCGSEKVAEYVDRKIVAPIDADDNGLYTYEVKKENIRPYTIFDYVDMLSHTASDNKEMDKVFQKALKFAEETLEMVISKGKKKVELEKKALVIYKKSKDKRIMILNKYEPFDFGIFTEPLLTVYKDLNGNWTAKSVFDDNDIMKKRILFPEKWAGKRDEEMAKVSEVEDAIFCHNGRHLMVAKSKEGLLKLVNLALR